MEALLRVQLASSFEQSGVAADGALRPFG